MEKQFCEGWRAARYVAAEIGAAVGIQGAPATAMLEVTLHRRGRVQRRFCFLDSLEGVLRGFCAEFPRARVEVHPDSAYGFVAQVHCDCGHVGSEGCCQCAAKEGATLTVVMSILNPLAASPPGPR